TVRFADVRGTPTPLQGRLGMRDLTLDAIDQAFRSAVVLYFVAGALATAMGVVGEDSFEHPEVVYAIAGGCFVLGCVFGGLLRYAYDWTMAFVAQIVHFAVFISGLMISVALYGTGPDEFMIATVVYLQPLILGCYLLRTPVAFVHIALIALEFGVVLTYGPPITHPGLQWGFLMGIGASGALILGRLADSAAAMAVSEHEARTALSGRLRQFLAAPVADAVAGESPELLAPHRRAIAVFFCDLRGFTSFASNAEPEDVVEVLGEYYEVMGRHLDAHHATFGSFAGDGVMAYFGDPLPLDNPTEAALTMALELAAALDTLVERWHRNGYDLNYGVGITHGHATLGLVGYAERSEYTAIGSVVNLASRLSDQAAGGQILLDGRAASKLGETHRVRPDGDRVLKGLSHPIAVFEAVR
ncbi:MAG: adenylate/guanylate cyclase domain-containing protein, partial [Acidimicrobiales bacterium]|nr:adenylate/guanylate cyclase domain-containing protein [Acidimicrobiales bacterium]